MRIGGWIEGPADSRQRSAVSGQDVGWELGDGGNWIDLYASQDDAASWAFRSRVGETAAGDRFNGNPPALVALADGRLVVVYFWCTVERPQTHVEATLFSTPLTDCSGV